MTAKRSCHYFTRSFCLVLTLISLATQVRAQSVVDRLSGFDLARIESVAQWIDRPNEEALGSEAAKLIYQVNRLMRAGGVTGEVDNSDEMGALYRLNGQAKKIETWSLPESLAEVLEFEVVYRVEVIEEDTQKTWVVLTSVVPNAWLSSEPDAGGRSTSTVGVVVRPMLDGAPAVLAASSLSWLADSQSGVSNDWALLGEKGFDVSLLEGVRSRDRQALQPEDATAFYSLLNIAASLGESGTPGDLRLKDGNAVVPEATPAADLLKESKNLVSRFLRLDLQTVRVTRIAVTEEITKQLLGSDHYWQLDAIGDLGNVVIRIESEGNEPAVFENRYPISVAIRELPDFLRKAMAESTGGGSEMIDVAMVSTKVAIDGFYYRMWSYESDFMDQRGGGNQFGPLVIGSRIFDTEPPRGDVVGVSRIGWYVAAMVILGIIAAIIGGIFTGRSDARAKRQLREKLPSNLGE